LKLKNEELSKRYDPREVGKRWYTFWLEKGYFRADENSGKPPFSLVIPPPNVTGSLHLGHALDATLQDIIIRHRRMSGYSVLWQPGTDHAGIATQNVVEKELAKEGKSRHDLGREKFIERVWEWKEKYGGKILEQQKELGASCDWDRLRFTMDDGLSKAVREVFVRLYEEGLIYRGNYMTNWCPRCHTALSDLEVEYTERHGHLYEIEYPFTDVKGGLVVATTRPETMLGDTAVAVNPEDERYKRFIGKKVKLPLTDREIPIIADEYVEADFGTGALKITPAHDPNDFEIGKRHSLEEIKVIGHDAHMINVAKPYLGLSREECRKHIVEDLKEQGFLKEEKSYKHSVGDCYRCKTVIEPNLSPQWFVKTAPLAEEAIRAVKEGDIEFVPKSWENTYFEWMNNIRDWCISRQIWWGHRIPAWYCGDCGEVTVSREDVSKCGKCGSESLTQETDVLDTWFSSALWPFSTLGWPDKTKSLDAYYPTSLLVTGFDIIFFWVARMIMMGLKFTGKSPFKTVYIHALIRDAEGKKMSKSKGNVIDPLDVVFDYGVDALRFTLCAGESQGRDARMSEKRIEGYRNFVNKIWNASRFVLMNLEGFDVEKGSSVDISSYDLDVSDRWILSRLQKTISEAEDALQKFRFNDLSQKLYSFTWNEFCDWYIEFQKERLASDNRVVSQAMLVYLLDNLLKLLHPVMPFITEEIYQKLPGHGESIMIEAYPKFDETLLDEEAEREMTLVMDMLTSIRVIRSELNIPPKTLLEVHMKCSNENGRKIGNHIATLLNLARLERITTGEDMERPPHSATALLADAEVYVPLEGVIDLEAERDRLKKEIVKVEKDLGFFEKKFSRADFVKNAPKEILEKDMARNEELKKKLSGLNDSLNWLA
jgi:valyl-tRNA synthetase